MDGSVLNQNLASSISKERASANESTPKWPMNTKIEGCIPTQSTPTKKVIIAFSHFFRFNKRSEMYVVPMKNKYSPENEVSLIIILSTMFKLMTVWRYNSVTYMTSKTKTKNKANKAIFVRYFMKKLFYRDEQIKLIWKIVFITFS